MPEIDDLIEQLEDLELDNFEEVRDALITLGIPNPTNGFIRKIVKRLTLDKCLCCNYHAESRNLLKAHIKRLRHRYGQKNLHREKDDLIVRVRTRLNNENIIEFRDLNEFRSQMTRAELKTYESTLYTQCFLILL
jgi:hypothetical protein